MSNPRVGSQLRELCAAISENNPICFELTWGFALEGCPKPSRREESGKKTSHNGSAARILPDGKRGELARR